MDDLTEQLNKKEEECSELSSRIKERNSSLSRTEEETRNLKSKLDAANVNISAKVKSDA